MKRPGWIIALSLLAACGHAAALGNRADIVLYDRTEGRELPIYWHEGRAYVAGKPGNEYQIRLMNQAGVDVLAVVSVDGVNVVTGETASPDQSGYALPVGAEMDIKGWRKSMSRTAAFYFTRLPDSYAARTGRPDNVGVIGAALFTRKPVEPPVAWLESRAEVIAKARKGVAASPPRASDESAMLKDSAGAEAHAQPQPAEKSLGTGHGRGETSYAEYTRFERASTSPVEVISIYYDSYANLLARGIVASERRPEPRPFPARFVPDPPHRR